MSRKGLLVNLNRCTGCWTCSMSCKVGHKLQDETWWNYVRTTGSGSGVDEPAGVWPDLRMNWMPVFTSECKLCPQRTRDGLEPYCSFNCPTRALTFGDLDDAQSEISRRMKELKDKGFNIFQLPPWENTRTGIFYAEKIK